MNLSLLEAYFERAHLGFKVLKGPLAGNPDIFQMDIRRSPRFGRYFRLWPGRGNKLAVLDVDRALRQLVLAVNEPQGERRYLVGMDDLDLFAAELPEGSTVAEAHRALKPIAVLDAEERAPGSTVRQGEWFFIRPYREELDELFARIAQDPRVSRAQRPVGGKVSPRAHVADELARLLPGHKKERVFARGRVIHVDHRPVFLDGWRRVVLNREVRRPELLRRNGGLD